MIDVHALAARQAQADRELTRALPAILPVRRARLLASPHAFFRGSARLYYELLAEQPTLLEGPPGEGWIVGDMHLENVGVWRRGEMVFDVNDVDEAAVGPRRLDVLRLLVSVLLAARDIGVDPVGPNAVRLARAALAAYARPPSPVLPPPLRRLTDRAEDRSTSDLLDDRAPRVDGRRRFVRGDRYLDLPAGLRRRVPGLVKAWPGEVVDAAWRVAGTGSLGVTRIAVLVERDDGEERLLDLKEASTPATAILPCVTVPEGTPASRVIAASAALLGPSSPDLVAVSDTLVARRLRPQEDKLAASRFGEDAVAVVRTIAGRLRRAHDRSGGEVPEGCDVLLGSAVTLAGLFEAVYLAYAALPEEDP